MALDRIQSVDGDDIVSADADILVIVGETSGGFGSFAFGEPMFGDSDEGQISAYVLDLAAGSYALTGSAAQLAQVLLLLVEPGSYALTGSDIGAVVSWLLNAAPGSYTLTGSAAQLALQLLLNAAAGSYTITGGDAFLWLAIPSGHRISLVFLDNRYVVVANENRMTVVPFEDRTTVVAQEPI